MSSKLHFHLGLKDVTHIKMYFYSFTQQTREWLCLTWSGLAGHGVLLNVRTGSVGIVRRLMDPPVGPLPE